MRDLGIMGESTFSLLCSSAGLIANGSQIDKTGWDYFVEFPIKSDLNQPFDLSPPPVECKVQVKATDDKKRNKISISLSNMYRLVKAQMPAFFCIIAFSGKDTAQSLYLIHVGKKIIGRTLKRLRQLEIENEKKIKTRTLTIKYNETHLLSDVSGQTLKSEIERYIPSGIEKYITDKIDFINTVGFENGFAQFEISYSTKDEDPVNKMIDLTLGLINKIKIDSFVGYNSRFQIVSPQPFIDYGSGHLCIPKLKSNKSIKLRIKENEYSIGYLFDADFYTSPLNNYVPQKHIKFRIVSKVFEFTFKPYEKSGTFTHFLNDDSINIHLAELYRFVKALDLIKKSKTNPVNNHP